MKLDTKEFEGKMQKSISAYQNELDSIRVGRANPAVLNKITVDYYGSATPINQIAAISTTDARTLVITPWDASTLKSIEKAILASDIGITPTNDGKAIRIMFPQLTEERRKELVKQIKKMAEDSKVAVRNIRRDANDHFKKLEKDHEITEDDLKKVYNYLKDLINNFGTQNIYCKKSCSR